VWIDADDIPSGARWRQELGSAIEAANAFVFVITPASVASAECQTELSRAVEVGKRLVPVLYRDAAGAPPVLLTYQYVDARDGTGLDVTVDKVVEAIDTDHDWVTAHTLWLGRALRWEESGRDRSTLLRRGKELRSAEEWLAGQSEDRKPPPTALQSAYIAESGRAERRRMRRLATAACIAVAVAVTLAVLALLQRSEAVAQRDEARSRELAAKSGQELEVDPELGILLALEALHTDRTAEGVDALRRAVSESRVRDVIGPQEGGVTTIAFSPDGSLIATGGEDGSVRISRSEDGSEVAALDAHDVPVRITTFDPSGERVLTAADDGTMRLWDTAAGALVADLVGHTDRVQSAVFNPDGRRLLTSGDTTARLWDVATGRPLRVVDAVDFALVSAAFLPGGQRILTGSDGNGAQIWDLETGTNRPLGKAGAQLFTVEVNADGTRAVTVGKGADVGATNVWDVRTGERVADLGPGLLAAVDPDGHRAVVTRIDGAAAIFDLDSGAEVATLLGHAGPLLDAQFSPDGRLVITAGVDNTARVWSATGTLVAVLRGHTFSVAAAAINPAGTLAATASGDGTARTWDLDAARELAVPADERRVGISSASFSPDGSMVLASPKDATVRLWRADTGDEVLAGDHCAVVEMSLPCLSGAVVLEQASAVNNTTFSPDGTIVATAGDNGTAHLFEANTGRHLATLRGHDGRVWTVAFSPDGRRIVTTASDQSARIWDTATGRELRSLAHPGGGLAGAVFSPDGATVATAGATTGVAWDADTGVERRRFDVPSAALSVAYSHDGRHLVVATDGGASIIDAATAEVVLRLVGHDGLASDAAYSDDDQLIVTAGVDGTARIWDANTASLLSVLRGHASAVTSARFNHDGSEVVTSSEDATVRVASCEICLPVDDLIARAERELTRSFRPDERVRLLGEG
jgi:WD40 repeat protein